MKNKVLIAIAIAAALIAIVTACAIDTNTLWFTIPCFASVGWLYLFVKVNRRYIERWVKRNGAD